MQARAKGIRRGISLSAAFVLVTAFITPLSSQAAGDECLTASTVPVVDGVNMLCLDPANIEQSLEVAAYSSGGVFAFVGPSADGDSAARSIWLKLNERKTVFPLRSGDTDASPAAKFMVADGYPDVEIDDTGRIFVLQRGASKYRTYRSNGFLSTEVQVGTYKLQSLNLTNDGEVIIVGTPPTRSGVYTRLLAIFDEALPLDDFSTKIDPDYAVASTQKLNGFVLEKYNFYFKKESTATYDQLMVRRVGGSPALVADFTDLDYYPVRLVNPKLSGEVYLLARHKLLNGSYRVYKVTPDGIEVLNDMFTAFPEGAVVSLSDGLLIQVGTGEPDDDDMWFLDETTGERTKVSPLDPSFYREGTSLVSGPKHVTLAGNSLYAGFTYRTTRNLYAFALGKLSDDRTKFELVRSAHLGVGHSLIKSDAMMTLGSSGNGLFVGSRYRGLMFVEQGSIEQNSAVSVTGNPYPFGALDPSEVPYFTPRSTVSLEGSNLGSIQAVAGDLACLAGSPLAFCKITFDRATGTERIEYQPPVGPGEEFRFVAERGLLGNVTLGNIKMEDPFTATLDSRTYAPGTMVTFLNTDGVPRVGVILRPIGETGGSEQRIPYTVLQNNEFKVLLPQALEAGAYELEVETNPLYTNGVLQPNTKFPILITEPEAFGPVEVEVPGNVAAGESFTLTGENMDQVESVLVGGVEAPITARTDGSITATLPDVSFGLHDVTLVVDGQPRATGEKVHYANPALSLEFSSWTKRISNTQAKLYAKNPVGVGKIEFKLNGREVAWVRAVDATDPKLRVPNEGPMAGVVYLVRTVNLSPGRNVLQIYVNGVKENHVVYSRR